MGGWCKAGSRDHRAPVAWLGATKGLEIYEVLSWKCSSGTSLCALTFHSMENNGVK